MSEEKPNEITSEESTERTPPVLDGGVSKNTPDKHLEVTINKSANEITFKDADTGESVTVSAKISEIEDEEEDDEPLTPDEFRTALKRVDALGLTWTGDRLPSLRPKEGVSDEVLLSDELEKIQDDYPYLPREIGALVIHILTGAELPEELIGNQNDLEKKAEIVRESILNNNYRSEYFFKYAIKVPYLTDIDWEVVFKLSEKNVKDVPGICYALLSLQFHNPNVDIRSANRHEIFTVAVNEHLVNNLIATLTDVKAKLETGQKAAETLNKLSAPKGENHANSNRKQLE